MNILGIDPGLSGAIALINNEGRFLEIVDIPTLPKKGKIKKYVDVSSMQLMLHSWFAEYGDISLAVLEDIHSMPGQGVASMFSMGDTIGAIRGVLLCENILIKYATPSVWKKHFKLTNNKDESIEKAKRYFREAIEYLNRKKDHNRAEALLLARYGLDIGAIQNDISE